MAQTLSSTFRSGGSVQTVHLVQRRGVGAKRSPQPCRRRNLRLSVASTAEPTGPSRRILSPPHSGYHYDATSPWVDPAQRFFEGWYFKITLTRDSIISDSHSAHGTAAPRESGTENSADAAHATQGSPSLEGESVAWMYAIEDPGADAEEGEGAEGRRRLFPGVAAQVMGPGNSLLLRKSVRTDRFWASTHSLSLGSAFSLKPSGDIFPKGVLPAQDFFRRVQEGFQVTPTLHQGCLSLATDIPQSSALGDLESVSWNYTTTFLHGWGGRDPRDPLVAPLLSHAHSARQLQPQGGSSPSPELLWALHGSHPHQRATAGWLAAFPVFEPHWQVCMAGGLSSGSLRMGERTVCFRDAPSYAEKNWGASFPLRWFWVQCNAFDGLGGNLAVTAGGGRRKVPWDEGTEDVAMIGVHFCGVFWEFVPWKGAVQWSIQPWGLWQMSGNSRDGLFQVTLEARTDGDPGVVLHAPTAEGGFQPMCRDSFYAKLHLTITRSVGGQDTEVILDAYSDAAAVEVGGGPWWGPWDGASESSPLQAAIVGAPVDVRDWLPWMLQPPGL